MEPNLELFNKTIVDLLIAEKEAISASELATKLRKVISEDCLPKRSFLLHVEKIPFIIKDDTKKKDMPYFSYNFLNKFKRDFNVYLLALKNFKSLHTDASWDELKISHDICRKNIEIVKNSYPTLFLTTKKFRVKNLPVKPSDAEEFNPSPVHQNNFPVINNLVQEERTGSFITVKPVASYPTLKEIQDSQQKSVPAYNQEKSVPAYIPSLPPGLNISPGLNTFEPGMNVAHRLNLYNSLKVAHELNGFKSHQIPGSSMMNPYQTYSTTQQVYQPVPEQNNTASGPIYNSLLGLGAFKMPQVLLKPPAPVSLPAPISLPENPLVKFYKEHLKYFNKDQLDEIVNEINIIKSRL